MSRGRLRIAIDGPSGAGKSTLARDLARRLGLAYLDTGAMYRAVAWKARQRGAHSPEAVIELLGDIRLEVRLDPDAFAIEVDGRDVTAEIRHPDIGHWASYAAAIPEVRAWLVRRQQELAAAGGVLEGRDIGTVVLPDADFKFFITADEDARLARRAAQLGGAEAGLAREDVVERDRRDRSRTASPLQPAADAVIVDTTGQSPEESLQVLLEAIGGGARGEPPP